MKEYTVTYTAEITEVVKTDDIENYVYTDDSDLAGYVAHKIDADDVHVKNIKMFEREVKE